MYSRSRRGCLPFAVLCLLIALVMVPCPAQAFTPDHYIESGGTNLGGRAKLFDETVSGFLEAYDIFYSAKNDPQAQDDPAINLYFAAARMANIIFREDGTTDSLRSLFARYGIILTGDSFSKGSPDEIEIFEPVDYDDNIILPGDAPDTEAIRSFLATSMISEINGALANLDVITNTPPFKEIIPAADIDSDTNLEIDYGDILLFKAVLKALKTGILIATAYDLDLDPHFLVMGINSEYGNFKQILDRFQDFLKLLPTATTSGDGASQLSLAETTLEAAIDDYLAASDEIRNDPGTEAGAEEFFAIGNCGLREEQLFRNMLSELKRSLQATLPGEQVANLIVYQEETWIIHDGSDVDKEIEVEFWEDEGEFWSTNWPDLFLAGGGDVDCITESGGTTTLYLALWDGPCSEGEATLTATYMMDATTVSGDFSVDYYDDSNPSCTDHSGTFTGTREVAEEILSIDLNPLFDDTPNLRDMLPEFDRYGEPQPGTMGNGLPGGPDPTLGGILLSSTEDGVVENITQDFWTQEFGFQPSDPLGPVTTISGAIDNSFPTGVGALRVGVFRPGMPVDADHLIAGTFYIENEIDNNPLTYQIMDVPMDVDVPLLVMAMWDHDLNGIDGPGDLWGGYSGNPLYLSGPRTDIDITLGQTFPAQISGTITYSAHTGDQNLIIWGSTEPGFPEHQVLFSQAVPDGSSSPIDYDLSGLPADRYFLYYFLDLNQNNKPDIGEPFAYQGYQGSGHGYTLIPSLDLAAQASYTAVDALLQDATLDPASDLVYFNVWHEQRPDDPTLLVDYVPYAPCTAISSIEVTGDELSDPIGIKWTLSDWHEYAYRIRPSRFQGYVIPLGEHTYTITVQPVDGTEVQYSDTPNIEPLRWATLNNPGNWDNIATTTTFQWWAVAGVDRYRLEIWDQNWIRTYSYTTSDATTLSYTLDDGILVPGETYKWRVTAYGPDGPDGSYSNRSRTGWKDFTVSTTDDFSITGSIMNVHQPDDSMSTYMEISISNSFAGTLPDDIDSITVTGPSDTVLYTKDDFTYHPEWGSGSFFYAAPGSPPEVGEYTFEVISDTQTATATDTQNTIVTIPTPDINYMFPADGATISSKTPSFSWQPVNFPGNPAYYRLEIRDLTENWVYRTSRTEGMLYQTLPWGILSPGQTYEWRVRAVDNSRWVDVNNRAHSEWLTFTMADPLTHSAMPAVDLDGWGVVTWSTEYGTNLDIWVRIIDHDGVSIDGSSHQVMLTTPTGQTYPMQLSSIYSTTLAGYSTFVDLWGNPPVAGDYTFTVTDPDGNQGEFVDTLTVSPLPPPDQSSFSPTDGTDTGDTTPTFTWAPVTGANRYRVRIYSGDGSYTVWRGYTENVTSYRVPPGVLSPNTQYRYQIDAWDTHNPLEIDNASKAPPSNSDNLRFTTGSETVDPFIELESGVSTWKNEILGDFLSFYIKVHDAQGVPGNIKSVKVSFSGAEEVLYYDVGNGSNTSTSGIYGSDAFVPLPAGVETYTFTVEDWDGHSYEVTEDLDPDPIDYPAETSLLPLHNTLIGDTDVDFDWDDVTGAAFYRVEIYDQFYNRIYRFATTESQYHLPAGFLEEGTLYRYRITTRREFFDQNVDNGSSSPWSTYLMPNFVTTSVTGGSSDPSIDLDNQGVAVRHVVMPESGDHSYWLTFNLKVTDPDGVPGNIKSVRVTYPDGVTTRDLLYDRQVSSTEAWYSSADIYDNLGDIQTGSYTFTVTDFDARTSDDPDPAEDVLEVNLLPVPTNYTPQQDSIVLGTTPTIDWDDVPGALRYRVRIYDGWNGTIHWSDYLSESSYTVPPGILDLYATYSYRIYAYREQAPDQDVDNSSVNTLFSAHMAHFTTVQDSDGDGLSDKLEALLCTAANDADTDDDGILDGTEDADRNGVMDAGETDPCSLDSDSDGIQDGTESGVVTVGSDTDLGVFQADEDPTTTTDPLNADTDGDGRNDGEEDKNYNGKVDSGELDPNAINPRALPFIPLLLDD